MTGPLPATPSRDTCTAADPCSVECGTRFRDLRDEDCPETRTSTLTGEAVYQAWHGTTEPWGGCADRAAVDRVLAAAAAVTVAADESIDELAERLLRARSDWHDNDDLVRVLRRTGHPEWEMAVRQARVNAPSAAR